MRQGRHPVCGGPSAAACMYIGKIFCPYDNKCHDHGCGKCPMYHFDDLNGACTDSCMKSGTFFCPIDNCCVHHCADCADTSVTNYYSGTCIRATQEQCYFRGMSYCVENLSCVHNCYAQCPGSPEEGSVCHRAQYMPEQDPCDNSPCATGATCVTIADPHTVEVRPFPFLPWLVIEVFKNGYARCICPTGYHGAYCELNDEEWKDTVLALGPDVMIGTVEYFTDRLRFDAIPEEREKITYPGSGAVGPEQGFDPRGTGSQDAIPDGIQVGPDDCNLPDEIFCYGKGKCVPEGCVGCPQPYPWHNTDNGAVYCREPSPKVCESVGAFFCLNDHTCVNECRNCRGWEADPDGPNQYNECQRPERGEEREPPVGNPCEGNPSYPHFCPLLNKCVHNCCHDCFNKEDDQPLEGETGVCMDGYTNLEKIESIAGTAKFLAAIKATGFERHYRCAKTILVAPEYTWENGVLDVQLSFGLISLEEKYTAEELIAEGEFPAFALSRNAPITFEVPYRQPQYMLTVGKQGNFAVIEGPENDVRIGTADVESDVGIIHFLQSQFEVTYCEGTRHWCAEKGHCVDSCCRDCGSDEGFVSQDFVGYSYCHKDFGSIATTGWHDVGGRVTDPADFEAGLQTYGEFVHGPSACAKVWFWSTWDSWTRIPNPDNFMAFLRAFPTMLAEWQESHIVEDISGNPTMDTLLNLGQVMTVNDQRIRIWEDRDGTIFIQGDGLFDAKIARVVASTVTDQGLIVVIDQLLFPRGWNPCNQWDQCPRRHHCSPMPMFEQSPLSAPTTWIINSGDEAQAVGNGGNCGCLLNGASELLSNERILFNQPNGPCAPTEACFMTCQPVLSTEISSGTFKRLEDFPDSKCFFATSDPFPVSGLTQCLQACLDWKETDYFFPTFNAPCIAAAFDGSNTCMALFNPRGLQQDCLEHITDATEIYTRIDIQVEIDRDVYEDEILQKHFTDPRSIAQRPYWPAMACDWAVEDWCPHLQKCVSSCCRECVASENPLDSDWLLGSRVYRFHDNQCELGHDNYEVITDNAGALGSESRTLSILDLIFTQHPEYRKELRCGTFFGPINSAYDTYPGIYPALMNSDRWRRRFFHLHTLWKPFTQDQLDDGPQHTIYYDRGDEILATMTPPLFDWSTYDLNAQARHTGDYIAADGTGISTYWAYENTNGGRYSALPTGHVLPRPQYRFLDSYEWGFVYEIDQFLLSVKQPHWEQDFPLCRGPADCRDLRSTGPLSESFADLCVPAALFSADEAHPNINGFNCDCNQRGSTCDNNNPVDLCLKACMPMFEMIRPDVGQTAQLTEMFDEDRLGTIRGTRCDWDEYYCPATGGCVASCAACGEYRRELIWDRTEDAADNAGSFSPNFWNEYLGRYISHAECVRYDPLSCNEVGQYYCGASFTCVTNCGSCGDNNDAITIDSIYSWCAEEYHAFSGLSNQIVTELRRSCGSGSYACLEDSSNGKGSFPNTGSSYCVSNCESCRPNHKAVSLAGGTDNICMADNIELCRQPQGTTTTSGNLRDFFYCHLTQTCTADCAGCSSGGQNFLTPFGMECIDCMTTTNPLNDVCEDGSNGTVAEDTTFCPDCWPLGDPADAAQTQLDPWSPPNLR
eukprot:TRINITY_DN54673_c0_g1_i1.p1 TRINITY_DN54673_c0_g1~~TRINITY_DN54673_c0_g1_i1.p1  ORF type:complete len:1890 (-),score=188.67 TRINITY_DN54673_c0_g1_i1:44-4864(-)